MDDPYALLRLPSPTPEDELCRCTTETPLVLQSKLTENPLVCARCNLEIPPERIGLEPDLVEALAWWRQFHDCFYRLWLDSGEFEEWAAGHLRDPHSRVNVRGREIVGRLQEKRPCYLWWFQDQSAEGWAPATYCPCCSRALTVLYTGRLSVCEECRLALAV